MKHILIFFLGALTGLPAAVAQEPGDCGTTRRYLERLQEDPSIAETQRRLEEETQRYVQLHPEGIARGSVKIVPVVFHIVHNYGPENISDAQVLDQVRILNEDFRLMNADTGSIIPAFKSIAADCEIEFRLANIDPNGNCTNGIDRIVSPLTENADDNAKLNPWPSNQYLNIWVVRSLSWSGVAAYAYYPGTAPPGADGIISIHRYIGSIGTGSPGTARVTTHEVGHSLNLAHVWGSTNDPGVACGDDWVFDTPVTEGWRSCNLQGATCGNVVDNVQNFMEYSYCCKMFSAGQKTRMHAALNSTVGGRSSLWSAGNLAATGTAGTPSLCAPIADFISNNSFTCAGGTIQYTDLSWNGNPTSWLWSFPGGTPSTSTDSMPLVQYASPGQYDATLTATNATGSHTVTKLAVARIGANPVNNLPYSESFEPAGSFPGPDGQVLNPDGDATWARVSGAASTGTHSIKINHYSGTTAGTVDDFITGAFDLTGLYVPSLTFEVAYSERDTSLDDLLSVSASDDCGATWVTRYVRNGSSLSTTGGNITPWSFTPNSSQWRQESVIFPTMRNRPNVRFRFQTVSEGGNNLYIDDINVTILPVGVEELEHSSAIMTVFPNPSQGTATLTLQINENERGELSLFDMSGRKIQVLHSGLLTAGRNEFRIGEGCAAGIYIAQWSGERGPVVQRFAIKP